MAKKSSKKKRRSAASSRGAGTAGEARPSASAAAAGIPRGVFAVGMAAVALSAAMSLMLVLDHIGGLRLPGCGEGSPCAAAAASVWGKVPGLNWPVSFVGFAYFSGALIAWGSARRGVGPWFRRIVRLGALLSLMFVHVLFIEKHLCSYCLAAHAGNFAFWGIVEFSRRWSTPSPASLRPVGIAAGVFVLASAVLGATEWREKKAEEQEQERDLARSTTDIIAATHQKAADPRKTADLDATPIAQDADATPNPETAPKAIQRPWKGGFRGRYIYGKEKAPVRLVMITDYQCSDCNRIEEEVREMLEMRDDVSLSVKHFPMCPDCNPRFKKRKHDNACWAARAVEAAGILGGNDGFWDMHFWLFDRDGGFTNKELHEGLVELGFDPAEFIQVLTGEETLKLVQSDIEEAVWLGLHYTPMVFINGVELKGVFAKNAIPRAVAAVAAKHPPPMTHEHDQPPPASEKYVSDWRQNPARMMPRDGTPWARGPDDAKVRVVIWGDYQEPFTAEATGLIEAIVARRSDVHYTFRHYPMNTACNPVVRSDLHPLACRAAGAAEAAGRLGGVDGYWKMHRWLMRNQQAFSDDSLRDAATEMGFDAGALFAAMDDPAVGQAIEEDCRAGRVMALRGVPMIFVNGKFIPRWRREGDNVLDRIIAEAAQD